MAHIRRRTPGRLDDATRDRHAAIRADVEREKPELVRRAREQLAEIRAAHEAMVMLRAERERRGLSLNEIAERTGIDKSRLSKLETQVEANPTFATVLRIAEAIGVTLTVAFKDAA